MFQALKPPLGPEQEHSSCFRPVLEIYAIWHPNDGPEGGSQIARDFVDHFHGTLFSGLIGGAVEIYIRSDGWKEKNGAPGPIPFPDPHRRMAWHRPKSSLSFPSWALAWPPLSRKGDMLGTTTWALSVSACRATPIGSASSRPCWRDTTFPARVLSRVMADLQLIAAPSVHAPPEPPGELRCRDLAQAIAQLAEQRSDSKERLTVFIATPSATASTKRHR